MDNNDAIIAFGTWMKDRRAWLNLTREALAQRSGCSGVALKKIESGERRPSLKLAHDLATALEIPPRFSESFVHAARTGIVLVQLSEAALLTTRGLHHAANPAEFAGQTSLPTPLTATLGRAATLADLAARLHDPALRLMTLVGPPGVGKTRLAIELAHTFAAETQNQTQPTGRVLFVPLATINAHNSPANQILLALSASLGLQPPADTSNKDALLDQVIGVLQARPCLLVLDNFEHLIAAAPLILQLLSAVGNLKVLVTSRQVLNLYGEHVQPVLPLLFPDAATLIPLTMSSPDLTTWVNDYPAIALFSQCVRATVPTFTLSTDNVREVSSVCALLDGLPLAIEIAAAQLSRDSLPGLLKRLEADRLKLRLGQQGITTRHQSLHNAIGHSYQLLTADEQQTFCALSVFVGSADAAGVAAVLDVPQFSEPQVLDHLHELAAKSLVVREMVTGALRFSMLETLREFGLDKLSASGREPQLRSKHAEYFLAYARHANTQLQGNGYVFWMDQFELNHNNCRHALLWCLQHDRELGLMLAESWAKFWLDRGHIVEGFEWFNRLLGLEIGNDQISDLADVRISTLAQARALCVLAEYSGDISGPTAAKQVATLLEQQVLPLFRQHGDVYDEAIARRSLGYALNASDEYARGRVMLEAALPFFRERQQDQDAALTLQPLIAIVSMADTLQGVLYAEEYVMRSRRTGNPELLARSLSSLSAARRWSANYEGAAAAAREAATLFRQINGKSGLIKTLMRLFLALKLLGQYDECRIVLKEYAELGSQLGLQYVPRNVKKYLGEIAYAEGNMHEALTHILASAVGALAQHDRREVGLCLTSLVPVLARLGQPHIAARISGAARACLKALAYEADPAQQGLIHDGICLLHNQLSEADFLAAQAESNAMSLEQAVAEARGVMAARDDLVNLDA